MKAKDYYNRFVTASDKEKDHTLLCVVRDLVNEVKTVAEIRRVQSHEGLITIVRELEDKWQAVVRMVIREGYTDLKESAFRDYIRMVHPGLYQRAWKSQNVQVVTNSQDYARKALVTLSMLKHLIKQPALAV